MPVQDYLHLLTATGFESTRVSGPTKFATSPTTLGFDFVARKPFPFAPPRAPSYRPPSLKLVATAAAVAVVIGVAMARSH